MPFAGGSGTSSDPYQIEDWTHLDSVRNNKTDSFILNNSLDENTNGYGSLASATANSGNGWDPIGALPFESGTPDAFRGEFDGNGFAIKDFVVDRPNLEPCGLFGAPAARNDPNVSVKDLFVQGDVTGDSRVGVAFGYVEFAQDIARCASAGSVTSNTTAVGGLAGRSSEEYIYNDCYSIASVNGESNVGGIIGRMAGGSSSGPRDVADLWAGGSVTGNSTVGGFVGERDSGSILDSYWDTQATGQSSGLGRDDSTETTDLTGLTTSDMQGASAATNMSDFDFSSTWETVESSDDDATADGYPILQGIDRAVQLKAQGVYLPPPDAPTNLSLTLNN